MHFETVEQAVAELKQLQQTQAAYNHAIGVLYHDAGTVAPSDSWEGRGKTMEILSKVIYELTTADQNKELFAFLLENKDKLDAQTLRETEVMKKACDQMFKIPADEYVAYSRAGWRQSIFPGNQRTGAGGIPTEDRPQV